MTNTKPMIVVLTAKYDEVLSAEQAKRFFVTHYHMAPVFGEKWDVRGIYCMTWEPDKQGDDRAALAEAVRIRDETKYSVLLAWIGPMITAGVLHTDDKAPIDVIVRYDEGLPVITRKRTRQVPR